MNLLGAGRRGSQCQLLGRGEVGGDGKACPATIPSFPTILAGKAVDWGLSSESGTPEATIAPR